MLSAYDSIPEVMPMHDDTPTQQTATVVGIVAVPSGVQRFPHLPKRMQTDSMLPPMQSTSGSSATASSAVMSMQSQIDGYRLSAKSVVVLKITMH